MGTLLPFLGFNDDIQSTGSGIHYEQVRFDYDGDIRNWTSLEGFLNIDALPASNTECESRLPSRVGL